MKRETPPTHRLLRGRRAYAAYGQEKRVTKNLSPSFNVVVV